MIGTNGAGKSTLINMLSGEIAAVATAASRFDGDDVTALGAAAARARRRRPQLPAHHHLPRVQRARELPPRGAGRGAAAVGDLGSRRGGVRREHCARRARRWPRPASRRWRQRTAGTLSHGAKRQLEIAMCLATRAARAAARRAARRHGRRGDRAHAGAARRSSSAAHAILLVEHDMDAVFRIADRITVMVNGAVIASDVPEAIRSNPEVRDGLPRRASTEHGRHARRSPTCTPTTATATCCAASTLEIAGRRLARPARPQRHGQDDADPHADGLRARRPAAASRWQGRDVTGAPPEQMARRGIGYVPEGRGIFPNLSVRENLVMTRARRRRRPRATGPSSACWRPFRA